MLRRLGKYGLDYPKFVELLEAQKYSCRLCLQLLGDDVSIDHDHETGKVRGLLHGICNVALGAMESKGRHWTENALRYLGWV